MVVNVVPDNVQYMAVLVGRPFTEQTHIMITSIAGEGRVEEIVMDQAANKNS